MHSSRDDRAKPFEGRDVVPEFWRTEQPVQCSANIGSMHTVVVPLDGEDDARESERHMYNAVTSALSPSMRCLFVCYSRVALIAGFELQKHVIQNAFVEVEVRVQVMRLQERASNVEKRVATRRFFHFICIEFPGDELRERLVHSRGIRKPR